MKYSKAFGAGAGGGTGTFISIILIWVLNAYAHVEMPPEVQAAVTGLITTIVGIAGTIWAPANVIASRWWSTFLALALLFIMSGCSLVPGGAQYEAAAEAGLRSAVADVQRFNDNELWTFSKGMCAAKIGALARMDEGQISPQKCAIATLCGLQLVGCQQPGNSVIVVTQGVNGPEIKQLVPDASVLEKISGMNGSTIEDQKPKP